MIYCAVNVNLVVFEAQICAFHISILILDYLNLMAPNIQKLGKQIEEND